MAAAQQAADPRRLPAQVKNRRLAAMRRLAAEGEYFSDEAMRHRAPLLYHQQIGSFAEQQERQEQGEEQEHGEEEGQDGAPVERQQHGMEVEAAGSRGGPTGQACSLRGVAGGVGGSCLAAALQQALGRHQDGASHSGAQRTNEEAAGEAGTAGGAGRSVAAAGSGTGRSAGPTGEGADGAAHAGPSSSGRPAAGQAGPAAIKGLAAAGAQGPAAGGGRGGSGRADLLFSEFLMRQDDEAQLVMRRMQEQQEEDEQFSEHESDEEDEGDGDGDGDTRMGDGLRAQRRGRAPPTASDLAQMRRDFVAEMESRFLLGQDGQYVDYSTIDADASLDVDWIEQESRDAEEKYFDED